MTQRLRLFAAALAALVLLPTAAEAKELMSLQVCGRGDCTVVRDPELLTPQLIEGSLVTEAPAREPFARLVLNIGDGREIVGRERSVFLPRAGLYRVRTGQWFRPGDEAVAVLRRITRELTLLPAARLRLDRTPEAAAPAPAPPAPASSAADAIPGWLAPVGAALLVVLLVVPLARMRRAPAG